VGAGGVRQLVSTPVGKRIRFRAPMAAHVLSVVPVCGGDLGWRLVLGSVSERMAALVTFRPAVVCMMFVLMLRLRPCWPVVLGLMSTDPVELPVTAR
jgi:hypothetical protein